MRRASRPVLIAGMLLMTATALAARPADDEITGDLKLMQGIWTGTLADGSAVEFEITEKKVITTIGDMTIESTVTVDEAATPGAIDFKIEIGPPDIVGLTALAIYKLSDEDKKLTICSGHPGEDRPGDFEEVEGVSMLFELERAAE